MSLRCATAFSLAALAFSGGARADQPAAHAAAGTVVGTAAVTHKTAPLASAITVSSVPSDEAAQAKIALPTLAKFAAIPAGKSNSRRQETVAASGALCVRAVGKAETGSAAWYGGRYIGRRTSSGSRLDTIHPTAAHRTLPLNSLARVTNLQNRRSVIVRVTDRGPVNASLLIDMSPKAADELQMKHAGVVPVSVEQVVEVPPDAK